MAESRERLREPFKVAAVEFDSQFLTLDKNLPRIAAVIEEAAKSEAKLILLPETSTSGYIYKDYAQLKPFLDSVPGKATRLIEPLAKQHGAHVVIGIAEIDPESGLA